MPKVEAKGHEAGAEGAARREVIVCVDDEAAVLDALRRSFRSDRYDVVATVDPREALKLVQSQPVSVVIADERMPEMPGSELLKLVAEASPSTGRILLTGYPSGTLQEACRRQGVQRFLTKPWRDEDLRRSVTEVLQERERAEGYVEIC